MSPTRRLRDQRGYSLVEMIVASAIMLVVTGAIFSLVNPSQGSTRTQPEISDLQQRARVAQDVLFKELVMVGAGTYQGAVTGSLVNFFAPILPRRWGLIGADAHDVFKPDAITIAYIPNTYSQTTISAPMPPNSSELKVEDQDHCPEDADELCGFEEGMVVMIFDASGNFDTFEITNVQHAAGHLQHRGKDLNHTYDTGSLVTQVVSYTYYLKRETNQLMRYDGGTNDVPLVDNVVDLQFSYFGDPNPPTNPKPPAGQANCLYDAAGNLTGLPILTPDDGSLVTLPSDTLINGPFCGSGANRFDADLLRVRKVRVSLRLQVSDGTLRGPDTTLWRNPGTGAGGNGAVPDYSVTFEVTPRNLNLTR